MDRTTQRHSLLSDNLANVHTPGYKRKDLDFNIVLDKESKGLNLLHDSGPTVDRGSLRQDGNSVDLESEVMNMAQTELRYQALTDMTANYFTNLKSVIRGGN